MAMRMRGSSYVRRWRTVLQFPGGASASSRSMLFFSTQASDDLPNEVPVMIVGGGPVGITLSILLARLGIQSLLVERRSKFSEHPQAHFINNRTMEIFRRLDGLGKEIQALQPPLDQWRKFIYCTALDGPVLGVVDHIHPEDLTSNRSPTSVAHLSQNRLLPILLKHASKAGIAVNAPWRPHSSLSNIFMGYECVSVQASSDRVLAGLRYVDSKFQSPHKFVACQYIVAADGAGSGVRKSMGVALEGEHNMQQLINVHFSSKRLGQYLADNRPAMLYFVFNPCAIAVIVAHDLRSGEFVAQMPFYPPQQTVDEFTKDACLKIIRDLMSIRDVDIEIKTVKPWVMNAEVAEQYICGQDRVILAGDAAHRFPPAGGFGMNTGIQDAHNLAWKLAAVLKGMASPALLHTYEEERRPIAKANTALSITNFKTAMSIPSALGLDPSYARMAHQAINSGVGSLLPKGLQSAILNGVFSIGRAQVSSSFLNEYNPIAQARIAAVQKILQQGRSLQLQFPAEDLFFRYGDGALVPEGGNSSEDVSSGRRHECVPSCVPGVRLPHMNIRVLHSNSQLPNSNLCSTLDLVDGRKVEFLLFVGCCKSGLEWAEDALEAAKAFDIPVRIVIVSSQSDERMNSDSELSFIREWKSRNKACYTEVVGVGSSSSRSSTWWEICGVPQFGTVLLVRPDDHIAWRSQRQHDSDSLHELKQVLGVILRSSCDSSSENQRPVYSSSTS